MEKLKRKLVDYAVASMAFGGQSESGDQYLVQFFKGGILLAVVDGLGHGAEAAQAARVAVRTLGEHAGESVLSLTRRCHEALRYSRGAVMSLARFNTENSSITWMGIGNVNGLLIRAMDSERLPKRVALLIRKGVVGVTLPGLQSSAAPVAAGDTLIFTTDGVADGFYDEIRITDPPRKIADYILGAHNKGTDDALVLVARFVAEEI